MEAHLLDCGSLEVERKILEPRIVAPKALHQEACRERERERERNAFFYADFSMISRVDMLIR
jgi:hypothetical protein